MIASEGGILYRFEFVFVFVYGEPAKRSPCPRWRKTSRAVQPWLARRFPLSAAVLAFCNFCFRGFTLLQRRAGFRIHLCASLRHHSHYTTAITTTTTTTKDGAHSTR